MRAMLLVLLALSVAAAASACRDGGNGDGDGDGDADADTDADVDQGDGDQDTDGDQEGGCPDPCWEVDCGPRGSCFVDLDSCSAYCLCDVGYHPEGLVCVADADADL